MKIDKKMSNTKIIEVFRQWLKSDKRSKNTKEQYGKVVGRFLKFVGKKWHELDKDDVDRWKVSMSEMADKSVVTNVSIVRQFFVFISDNCKKAQSDLDEKFQTLYNKSKTRIRAEPLKYKWLSYEEGMTLIRKTESLNKNVKEATWKVIIRLLLCGLRRNEVIGIRVRDVDLDRGIITIPESVAKGRHARVIRPRSAFPHMISDLSKYLETNPPKSEDDPFVRKKDGSGFSEQTIYDITSRLSQLYIGRQVRVHSLRHWSCSALLWMGLPQKEVQSHMGHKSLNDTDTYDHVVDWEDDLRDAEQSGNVKLVAMMTEDKNRLAHAEYERKMNGNGHPATPTNGVQNGDVKSVVQVEKIKLLQDLHENGRLTSEEYAEEVKKTLSE